MSNVPSLPRARAVHAKSLFTSAAHAQVVRTTHPVQVSTENTTMQHGRSVTEIWERDEIKNMDLLGDENSNIVMHAQKA